MSITNSSHIVITESTFNHVQGNQVNINLNAGRAVVKRTKYDQFRQVIRGDMITLKELSSEEIAGWEWSWKYRKVTGKRKARRTICTIEVYPDRQSKFTAVMYEGKDAKWFWKNEFENFSRTRTPLVTQLFGINRSEIPTLIFHDELIPYANVFNKESIWMGIYIKHLMMNIRCNPNNLWINTASGVFFIGPNGPSTPYPHSGAIGSITVPTTVDMLKDDTCLRFFASFGSTFDNIVVECAYISVRSIYLDDLVSVTVEDRQYKDPDHPNWRLVIDYYLRNPVWRDSWWRNHWWCDPLWCKPLWCNPWWIRPDYLPMKVIGELRFDAVYSPSMEAVARWPRGVGSLWEWQNYNRTGLVEETVLDDGLTRFKLDPTRGEGVYLDTMYHCGRFWKGWLSQSSQVFDAIEVAGGMENFFTVIPPDLRIQFSRRPTASRTLRNGEYPVKITPPTPIYLFLHPLPMSVSECVSWIEGHFCFWSFDEIGQSRMSEEECERWGLPVLTASTYDTVCPRSWFTYVYTTLQDWQKARGFDPATSDWARHMGDPELEIVGARKVQEEKKASSSWWEAIAGSGISAFAI